VVGNDQGLVARKAKSLENVRDIRHPPFFCFSFLLYFSRRCFLASNTASTVTISFFVMVVLSSLHANPFI